MCVLDPIGITNFRGCWGFQYRSLDRARCETSTESGDNSDFLSIRIPLLDTRPLCTRTIHTIRGYGNFDQGTVISHPLVWGPAQARIPWSRYYRPIRILQSKLVYNAARHPCWLAVSTLGVGHICARSRHLESSELRSVMKMR